MEINFSESKEKWDNFVSFSPERSIFVQTKFLDSLGKKYDLITCKESGKIMGGLPVIMEDKNPVDHAFPFTEYQGLLLANNFAEKPHSQQATNFKTMEFLVNEATKHYKQLCLCHSWRLSDLRPIQWFNYHEPESSQYNFTLRYTAILDISKYSDFDEYLMAIRKVRRQEIKKGLENLRIEEISDEGVLDDLHEKTFQRQGIKRPEWESVLLKSITRKSLDNNFGRLTCVKIDGIPVAANLFLFDDRTGFYLFGANHPDYRNSGAGALLLGEAIRYTMEKGLKEVDFVGANSPNRGDYKLSFNSELRPYFITTFKKT